MSYDSTRGRTLMVGGYLSGTDFAPFSSELWEYDAAPWRQPAVQFDATTRLEAFSRQDLTGLRVRARCAAADGADLPTTGAELLGWATGGPGRPAGAWSALTANTATLPFSAGAPAWLDWRAGDPEEAQAYVSAADSRLSFQCRPRGTNSLGVAQAGLDFVEVRVRHCLPDAHATGPALCAVSPARGTPLGGTVVTLTGAGFAAGDTVTIGGAPVTGLTVVGPSKLVAITPAGSAGAAEVTVTAPDGTADRLPAAFLYEPPAPGASPGSALASCRAIRDAGGAHGDGVYWLSPASGPAYPVWCDMTIDGGGWTLVGVAAGTDSSLWTQWATWTATTASTANATNPMASTSQFSQAFVEVAGTDILGREDNDAWVLARDAWGGASLSWRQVYTFSYSAWPAAGFERRIALTAKTVPADSILAGTDWSTPFGRGGWYVFPRDASGSSFALLATAHGPVSVSTDPVTLQSSAGQGFGASAWGPTQGQPWPPAASPQGKAFDIGAAAPALFPGYAHKSYQLYIR